MLTWKLTVILTASRARLLAGTGLADRLAGVTFTLYLTATLTGCLTIRHALNVDVKGIAEQIQFVREISIDLAAHPGSRRIVLMRVVPHTIAEGTDARLHLNLLGVEAQQNLDRPVVLDVAELLPGLLHGHPGADLHVFFTVGLTGFLAVRLTVGLAGRQVYPG